MVGLVLVAHSAELVRGLAAMVVQAAPGVPAEAAGGLSRDRLGTSAPDIAAALERALARAGDGVLVLLDLGSAWMAVELALEMLEPSVRARVRVTEAPLVEGAVHAAVAAGRGANLSAVEAAAADGGFAAKRPAG
jgi:phosphoenolpyruvate---glycerone phosphotransferase subunit DhaM